MPKGDGEAAEPKTLDQIMASSWDETYGEDTEERDDEYGHLGAPNDPEEEPEKETSGEEAPEGDTGTQSESAGEEDGGEQEQEREEETSSQAPDHWSNEDREMFAKLDQNGKDFLLRRHRQMEGDYTRKTQENAEAIKVGKLFDEAMDPAIKADLMRIGVDREAYVRQMMQWHHMSVNDPAGFVRSITQQLRLDPAQVFTQTGESQETQPADPMAQRIAAVESHLSNEQRNRHQQVIQQTQERVNSFKDAVDDQGNPLHPHFETVRKDMATFVRVDPNMPLEDAYQAAVYKNPELRAGLMNGQPAQTPSGQNHAERTNKALRAKKSNIKSRSGSVEADKKQVKMSLRDSMNAAADDIGLN